MDFELKIYSTEEGKEPFSEWMKSVRSLEVKAFILQRLQRVRLGNFGDCKPLKDGLWELRLHQSSGLRVYYSRIGKQIILLVLGGSKDSQNRDINQARVYLEDYRRRFK